MNAAGQAISPGYYPNELIVQLNYRENVEGFLSGFNSAHSGYNIQIKRILSGRLNIWLIGWDDKLIGVEKTLTEIKNHPAVALAQFNHSGIKMRGVPNDSLFSNQWDMLNDGNNGNVAGADISAPEAWDIATGGVTAKGDTIVVAVIDGGFDLNHPDLDFWKNRNEIPGNTIDDDNNGYADDYDGWNSIDNNGDVGYSGFWDQHATHVSGTVGAKGNNNIGVAGVNWNVKILPVSGSSSNEAEVVAAYGYILEMRARYDSSNGVAGAYIVSTNSSFGVDYGQPADYPIWCAMYDSMGKYGIVSAGATINSNVDVDAQGDIPTACPSGFLISVTNTNSSDQKVSGAGYGLTTIDIGAPGDDIWSTVPPGDYEGNNWTGTSMATPHVAGAIALMYSAACDSIFNEYSGNRQGLALLMRDLLLSTGYDSIPSLQGKTVTGGRLNLHKALLGVQSVPACDTSAISVAERHGQTFSVNVFPNPFKEMARVEIGKIWGIIGAENYRFIMNDVFGREVLDLTLPSGLMAFFIERNNLQNGVFFYRLISENEIAGSGKIVIE